MGDVIIDGLTGANRLVILDANGKIPALDGSAVTALAGANFSSGTIPVARIDTGTTAGKVVKLDGNAKLPAVSGAALTGVAGATKNASDPTVSTNPSGGVGTEWHNTTSGEVFVCTDATAGGNVWKNVGDQSGDIAPYSYGGSDSGHILNGHGIDKVSFASDGNATEHGNMATGMNSTGRQGCSGLSSLTHAYACGGYGPGQYSPNTSDTIERYLFSAGGTMVDVGNMILHMRDYATSNNATHGFVQGGYRAANDPSGPAVVGYDHIQQLQFAATNNMTDVANLTSILGRPVGHTDAGNDYAYTSGGNSGSQQTTIQRHSMTSVSDSVSVGNLRQATPGTGTSSATHGFGAGQYQGGNSTEIQKFAFSSSTTTSDHGDIPSYNFQGTGFSSTDYGYIACGGISPSETSNIIWKYSFASSGNSTDVGDMTVTQGYLGPNSCQV